MKLKVEKILTLSTTLTRVTNMDPIIIGLMILQGLIILEMYYGE